MRRLTAFLKFDQVSFLILVLPYLAFCLPLFVESPFFNLPKFLLTLVAILLIDVLVKLFVKRYQGAKLWISLLIYGGVLLLLYSHYFILPFIFFMERHFPGFHIRGRILIIFFLALFALLVLAANKKRWPFNYFVNTFMLLLFGMSLCTTTLKLLRTKKSSAVLSSTATDIHFDSKDSLSKPVILIITDEYSSPVELYKHTGDSSFFDFSRKLAQAGWIVRDSSFSYETSSINSLSSIWNFNFSEGGNYQRTSLFAASKYLMHCKLADSLDKKNIGIINFGIFDFSRSKPLNRLYLYPKSYRDVLFYNSALAVIYLNTGSMNTSGFGAGFNAYANHNRQVLETLKDSLQRLPSDNYFVYVHLLLPHNPFNYFKEFNSPITTENYLAYWKFANKKFTQFLNGLCQSDRYRIIVTGDHGYRGDLKEINPHYTATAFWGFGEKDVEKIRSVQDLGALINAYLK